MIDKLPAELEFGHMEKILASQVKSLVEKAKLKGRVDGQKLARKLSYQRGKSTVSSLRSSSIEKVEAQKSLSPDLEDHIMKVD